ncbi:MAG TPA: VWA domain-containing protein [Fimbriiglobus sp.]|nr:VWA domain-containing protein [Fimbriiglobus sp.]
MPSFANPEFLLLAPLAVLVAWWWARRRRPALRYSDVRLLAGLPRGRARWANWGGAALRGLAVLAAVLAAAGPRTPDLRTRLPAEGIAIVLVLDVSGSMATPDFAPSPGGPPVSRLDAAKQTLRLFVAGGDVPDGTHFDGRPRDQIGLVAFAAVPETAVPLTLNHSVLLAVLDTLQPKAGIDAGTNVGDALAEGLLRLDAAGPRRKVMVLLSDGEHNVLKSGADAPLKPRQAAQLAANLGVPVYAVDCGGEPRPDAMPDEVKQRADGRRVLEAVAALTGGRSFAADTADELRAVYKEIDALERQPAETFRYRRYHEFYPWCAVAAVGLLGAAYLLDRTWWRRVPG